MITHDSTFETLALAPIKQTNIIVARQFADPYGYYDDGLTWASSDLLMSVKIDAVGQFLGTVTKKAVVKLLGIVTSSVAGDIFQIRVGIYNNDPSVSGFNYISEGFFIVDNINYDYDSGSTTITLYDHMWTAQHSSYTDTNVSTGFTYPATVSVLAQQMASAIGVDLMAGFSSLPNASYNILVDPYATISNATLATVIQEIAQTTGTTARISNGTLTFVPYSVSSEILDSSALKTLRIGKPYGDVTSVVLGRIPQNDNVVISRVAPLSNIISAIDPSTNLITITGNGMVDGNLAQLSSTGTLPAPLLANTNYYVYTGGSANTFSLTPTYADGLAGTNIIDITTSGTGTITLSHLNNQEVQINNNQIMDDDRLTLLPNIYPKLVGVGWSEVKADTVGLGWHEVGDVISFSQAATITEPFVDKFDRTVANGWGSPLHGGLWSNLGGTSSAYFVDGDAKITPAATNVAYYETLDNTVSAMDSELVVSLTVAPTGAANSFSLITNFQDSSNHNRFRLTFNTTGSVVASITKVVAGTETSLASGTVGTGYVNGEKWHINGTFDGTSYFTMRAWKEGDARPSSPSYTATDSTFTSGKLGIRAFQSPGATNATTFVMNEFVSDFTQTYAGTKITKAFLSEVHLIFEGGIKENLVSVIPDVATINYQTAGGVLKTIYNTEIKVDKQNNEIVSVVSQQDIFATETTNNFTELYQNLTDILLTIQKSGGGNLVLNSVGFATEAGVDNVSVGYTKLSFWDYNPSYQISTHGAVSSFSSSESQNAGGTSGQVIQMSGASVYISQRINVAANTPLSFALRVKNAIGTGSATITISNTTDTFTIPVSNATAYVWDELKLENFVSSMSWVDVKIQVSSATAFLFTDLRLLYGTTLQGWVQSSSEILSTNVQFSKLGMKIFDNVHDTETQVTYNEFSTRRKADGVVLFEADDSGVVTNDLSVKGSTTYINGVNGVVKQVTIPASSALAGIAFIKAVS